MIYDTKKMQVVFLQPAFILSFCIFRFTPSECIFFYLILDLSQFQQIRDLGFPSESHDMNTLAVWLTLFDNTCSNLYAGDTCFLFFLCLLYSSSIISSGTWIPATLLFMNFTIPADFRDDDTNLYRFSELFCFLPCNLMNFSGSKTA